MPKFKVNYAIAIIGLFVLFIRINVILHILKDYE